MKLTQSLLWSSAISPDAYLANYSDSMIRLESPSWKLGGDFQTTLTVQLPNRIEVILRLDKLDFERTDYDQLQSTLLWIHSLGFLPQLLALTKDAKLVNNLLDEYSDFIARDTWQIISRQMTSLDHSIAIRIRSMGMLAAQFTKMDVSVPDSVLSILKQDLAWSDDTSKYAQNNHGMMLAAAVLHTSYMFPAVVAYDLEALAESQLQNIVMEAFDSHWICRENTAIYQAFYINFCTAMLRFVEATQRSTSFSSTLAAMIAPASKTLQNLILPNGQYPAMGDSGGGTSGIKSVDGILFSEESGIFVDKKEGVYRTLKCGFSSHVHKHADDTSLTLSIDGDELLLDGGLHSYDWKNPYTLGVKSQRGHSGIFFPEFDHLYSGTLYHPKHPRIRSGLKRTRSTLDETELTGECHIDKDHFVRRISVFGQDFIDIQDFFSKPDTSEDLAIQRFLVPAEAALTVGQGEIRIKTACSWMTIQYDPLRDLRIRTGTTEPIPYGWISRSWGEKVPCVSIDISPRSGWSSMNVQIRYGRI